MTVSIPPLAHWSRPAGVAVLALAYLAAGKFGLLLAIPPGYATAIFPSSGIAMAALLLFGPGVWPGVFLGSFLLNAWGDLAIAVAIAGGASLQALLAAFLVRRLVASPTVLDGEGDILGFLVLGGPVACVVSAAVGSGSLALGGVVAWSEWPFTAWTWWVGDTIGVVITAPLVLAVVLRARPIWRGRLTTVALPAVAAFIIVVAVFFRASAWERERIRFEFRDHAVLTVHALQSRLSAYLDALAAIERLFASSESVEPEEFAIFVASAFERHPGILALEWVPRVGSGQRRAFEAAAGVRIVERDDDGNLVPAGERSEHFPVRYIEPRSRNEKVRGFDLASEPIRRKALAEAWSSGRAIATARVGLVQEQGFEPGFLVFHPIYGRGLATATEAERKRALIGFTLAVFRSRDIVDAVLEGSGRERFRLVIEDEASPPGERRIYDRGSGKEETAQQQDLAWTDHVEVAGSRWMLRFAPTARYSADRRSWQAWVVFAGGLLFTSLLQAFLLMLSGRADRVERLVEVRTAELSAANAAIRRDLVERERVDRLKSEFVSVVSHELRTPLTSIIGALGLIRGGATGALDSKAGRLLDLAYRNSERLLHLINDILDIEKIEAGKMHFDLQPCDLVVLTGQAVETNHAYAARFGATIAWMPPGDSATAMVDPQRFAQVMANLLSNAAKFSPSGSEITVLLEAEGGRIRIGVSDQGPGIPEAFRPRVFERFSQADSSSTREKGGTGLGLSICKAIVERMGGTIGFTTATGGGATFRVEFPAADDGNRRSSKNPA